MARDELLWLAERASEHSRIAEIGSWMGRSTRALADNTSGTVYAVDTWLGSEEHAGMLQGRPDNYLLDEFVRNMGDLVATARVCPIRMDSRVAARIFWERGTRFDMIFIDASHDYENVKADIVDWKKVLAPGGLLCGHDFGCAEFPGVTRAILELIPKIQIPGNGQRPNSIWYAEDRTGGAS